MKTPRRPGQQQPNDVLSVVMDQHNCHAMTEELLDTWWNSLAPEEKAEVHLASLDTPDNKTLVTPPPAWIREGLALMPTPATQH